MTSTDRERTPPRYFSCGCGARWTGLNAAHCASCHHTFSAPGLFDAHRSAIGSHGTCLEPSTLTGTKAMTFRAGMWRGPEMDEAARLRRFRRSA